jgi:acetylornithine deacetylase/succinyl-diaminopimelate desuccinylase-like protein
MTSDFKNLLTEYVALKSVSTDPQYKGEMLKTAEWIKAYLQKFGFTVEFIQGPTGNPIVFASLTTHNSLPTVLIYGHYDVQPSDQFDLKEIDGRFVGRGVVDNKGQKWI